MSKLYTPTRLNRSWTAASGWILHRRNICLRWLTLMTLTPGLSLPGRPVRRSSLTSHSSMASITAITGSFRHLFSIFLLSHWPDCLLIIQCRCFSWALCLSYFPSCLSISLSEDFILRSLSVSISFWYSYLHSAPELITVRRLRTFIPSHSYRR